MVHQPEKLLVHRRLELEMPTVRGGGHGHGDSVPAKQKTPRSGKPGAALGEGNVLESSLCVCGGGQQKQENHPFERGLKNERSWKTF